MQQAKDPLNVTKPIARFGSAAPKRGSIAPMQTASAVIPLAYQTVISATRPSWRGVAPRSAVIGSAAARQRTTTGGTANRSLARSRRHAESGLIESSSMTRPSLGTEGPPMTWARKKELKAGTASAARTPAWADVKKMKG